MTAKENKELRLPSMLSTREQAKELVSKALGDSKLSDSVVRIDGSGVDLAAPGFVDELCKQILEVRSAKLLTLKTSHGSLLEYALRAVRLRGYSEKLLVLPSS